MKVVLATHNFPPEFVGGVERVVDLLAADLAAAGHEITVFTGSGILADAFRTDDERRGDVPVRRVHKRTGYDNFVDPHDPRVDMAWAALLREVRPDVVHVHHWHDLTTGLVAGAAREGIPAVCTLHDYWTTCTQFFRMPDGVTFCREAEREEVCGPCVMRTNPMDPDEMHAAFTARFASIEQEIALARAIIVNNAGHAETLRSHGRYAAHLGEKVREIPLGTASLAPLERPDGDGKVVVAHWGNLAPVKGLMQLVEACARSAAAPRLRLRVLGEGVDAAWLESVRAAAGEVELELAGAYTASDLPARLADVDVAVFPSLAHETHSLVLDEALQLGMPVIVSDRGAMSARVGDRGVVVPAGDVDALAAAVDRLCDPAERAALRSGAPAGALLTTAEYAERVAAVYHEAVAAGPPEAARVVDHALDRLAFRNDRLHEIHQFVLTVEGRREDVERAVQGDADALARVRSLRPAVAEAIERLLHQEDRTP